MKQCPICGEGKLYPKVVERKLHYSICDHCHSEQADNSQIRLNNNPWQEAVIDKLLHRAPKGKQLVSRRDLDNVKVRAYELGQQELHDMILNILNETAP